MSKEICTVCGREIDSRGMSGHMKIHKGKSKKDDTEGVISYPSNGQEIEKTDTVVDLDVPQGKRVKKSVKKTAASKPASSSASKPDPRGQRNTGSKSTGHPKDSGAYKKEWQGLFRD